jgi:hypothetical protein
MKRFLPVILVIFSFFTASALPAGYAKVKLGMSVDELKDTLKKDHQFGYRGDRDVSLSPTDGEVLVETDATYEPFSFLERCWFQFSDEKLYIITINLDQSKVDHYSVFSALCKKYGNPVELSPQKSTWKDDSVIMTLEKPLALKYVDAKAYEKKAQSSNVQKTTREQAKEHFLDSL